MELLFASQNKNKAREIEQMLEGGFTVKTLADLNYNDDIPETANTLEGNALLKAKTVFEKFGVNCFADDSGLEIEALHGRPGVLSARYAGEQKNADDNMNRVLEELQGLTNRKARFRTVIAFIVDGKEHLVEGVVNGIITIKRSGNNGFGYDPIFMPEGSLKTFAEMTDREKNAISHRARAIENMVQAMRVLK